MWFSSVGSAHHICRALVIEYLGVDDVMDWEIAVFWLWLCISIAIALLGSWVEYRGLTRGSLYLIVSGLSLLVLSLFFVHPAVVRSRLPADVPALRDQLVLEREEKDRALSNERAARAAFQQLSREHSLQAEVHTATKKLLSETQLLLATANTERERLVGALLEADRRLARQKQQHQEAKSDIEQAEQRHKGQVSAITKIIDEQVDPLGLTRGTEAARRDFESALARLRAVPNVCNCQGKAAVTGWLDGFQSGPYIQLFRDSRRLLADRPDIAFKLLLRNPRSPQGFAFSRGAYTFAQDDEGALREAMQEFKRTVIPKLAGHVRLEILIRGFANKRPFATGARAFDDPRGEFHNVSFVVAIDPEKTKYSVKNETQALSTSYENKHLPNLRAAYVGSVWQDVLPDVPATVLDGVVTDSDREEDQTFELVLLVD